MRIERLHLTNFRGIADCVLELPDAQTVVLVGANGSGKSSILDCAAILLSVLFSRIRSAQKSTRRRFRADDIRRGQTETTSSIRVRWKEHAYEWSMTRTRPGRVTRNKNDFREAGHLAAQVRSDLTADDSASVPLAILYPVNRAVLVTRLRTERHRDFDQLDAFDVSLDGIPNLFRAFFAWFRTREDYENERWRDEPGYRDVQLEAVRKAIEALMPGYTGLRVRRNPLRMVVTKQAEELDVGQLSDGEKCMLALAGDLARRLALANPGLNDPLLGNAVVMIDEIELHLHPAWQRNAIPCLEAAFSNCQFIISTHSAPVLGHVRPEGVLLLSGRGEEMRVDRITTYGQDANRILEEVFGTPTRPWQFDESLDQLFREIDLGKLEEARSRLGRLEGELGSDEPELTRARVMIRRKELIGK